MTPKINAKITESIFGVFYVMTEGEKAPGGNWKFFCTISLLLIDSLQVLRSMACSKLGWTSYSISVMRSIDLVSLFFTAVQNVIPEWFFFSFSILLAVGAIANATYVMKLFRAGQVKILWPLKLLRFLVASIVTVFFTTVLEFGIYPVRCIDAGYTFSSVVHGEDRECSPWAMPEMAVSIPTIMVAVAFIFFSLLTTFLDFTINPLARHPLAICTGRLEFLWTLFKVAALLLVYMEVFISAEACAIILFLLSAFIMYYHCIVLPFHNKAVNMVRGGIYGTAVVFCLANIVILHYPDGQALQNWFLGAIPVAFVLGMIVVGYIYQSISRYLDILRGQWDERMAMETATAGRRGQKGRRNSMVSEANAPGGNLNERSMFDKFFDVNWAAKRRFSSGTVAYLATRILLQRQNEEEMPFLMNLLTECLQDHPNSIDLSLFHLLSLRYVFKERNAAVTQEKLSKMQSQTSVLDRTYVVFALNKKTAQEGACESLGKGSISAVNLMEFDQRMAVADKSHRDCIDSMKEFWKNVAKNKKRRSKAYNAPDRAKKMTDELDKFTKAMYLAMQEYAWLYEKYPSSAALLHAYANFCDHVLNDSKRADSLRQQVMVMESYGQSQVDEEEDAERKQDADDMFGDDGDGDGDEKRRLDDQKSCSTDTTESYRSQMTRYMGSWSHLIMARDADMLKGINFRIRCAIFFLCTLSLTGFIVTDFVLFNDVALKTIRDIEETGKFRELAATAPYMLRSQMIESQRLNLAEYDRIKASLIEVTRQMQTDHYITFEKITTKKIQEFYDDPSLEINIPSAAGWELEQQSFRHLGTDFARRVASAASASYAEHSNTNYKLSEISQEKQDISYVFENMIRYVLPAFDQAVVIYQKQMDSFGALTTALTTSAAGLTSFVVLIIAIDVLRARVELLKRVQANRVSICLALQVPHHVAVKFYKYFSALELEMAIMDEEEHEARRRIAAAPDDLLVRGGSNFSRRMSLNSNDSFSPNTPKGFGKAETQRGGERTSATQARRAGGGLRREESRGSVADSDMGRLPSGVGSTHTAVHHRKLLSPVRAATKDKKEEAAVDAGAAQGGVQREMSFQELTANNLKVLMDLSPEIGMADHPMSPICKIPKIPKLDPPVLKLCSELPPLPPGEEGAIAGKEFASDKKPDADEAKGWNVQDVFSESEGSEDDDDDDICGVAAGRAVQFSQRTSPWERMVRGLAGARRSSVAQRWRQEREEEEEEEEEEGAAKMLEREAKKLREKSEGVSRPGSSENEMVVVKAKGLEEKEGEKAATKGKKKKRKKQQQQQQRAAQAQQAAPGVKAEEEEEQEHEQEQAAAACKEGAGREEATVAEAEAQKGGEEKAAENESPVPKSILSPVAHRHPPLPDSSDKHSSPLNILSPTRSRSVSFDGEEQELLSESASAKLGQGGEFEIQLHVDAMRTSAESSPVRMASVGFADGLAEKELKGEQEMGKAGGKAEEAAAGEGDGEGRSLELNEVEEDMQEALVSLQFIAQPWFNRWYVYVLTLAILMALCMMFSLYPARRIPIITNMGPSVNRAAERQSLARGCITLSRELVLRDGLSRMTHGEISGTLAFFIDKFEEVDKAVRLGNLDYDIVYGADHRSVEHNDFMYMLGCPWREDPSDCTLPNNTYTRAAEDGLFNLQSVFLTSLKSVLLKYGSSPDEYVNTYDLKRDNLEDASEFDKIYPNQAAYDLLLSDPDLRFLDLMFAGDLFQGLDRIVDLFEAETRALLDDVHVEVRLLFGIYMGFLLQVFYSALFLRTLRAARLEVSKAKEYAHTLPLHVLDGDQAATVKRFYMRNNGHDDVAHLAEDE